MKTTAWISGALVAVGVAAIGAACSTPPQGQLMVAFQTDMSLPKDIDTIRIVVSKAGLVIYDQSFEKLGSEEAIRLPATLGFLPPEEAGMPLTIRVIGSRGESSVRVLREVITTVPADRTVTLSIPIQFLCDGSAELELDENGQPKRDSAGNLVVNSTCPAGQTCVSGTCAEREVDSGTLPDFIPEDVFGGGTGDGDGECFDTATCFESGVDAQVDLAAFALDGTTCRATAGGAINVALRTQGGGICGDSACFVALDAESDLGWKANDETSISLPVGVCAQLVSGQIVGVTSAPVGTGACQLKREGLPTCGPWTSAGTESYTPPPANEAVLIASGQLGPVAITLAGSNVYWTSAGTFDVPGNPEGTGSVKFVPKQGGQPTHITTTEAAPRDLVVDEARQYVFWTDSAAGELKWANLGFEGEKTLTKDRLQPEGIALNGALIYWTERGGSTVFQATTVPSGNEVVTENETELAQLDPPGFSPHRIAVANNAVCWTYQGMPMAIDGSVACEINNSTLLVSKPDEPTPRALALEVNGNGTATAVIWACFADQGADGGIFKVELDDPELTRRKLASVDYANGLAIRDGAVFWTSVTAGTVKTRSLTLSEDTITDLARDQSNPGAIAVDATDVYWLNEGTPNEPNGAVMKVAR